MTAANADGVWNPTGASLAYTVLPLFWQTTGFRWMIGMLIAGEGALIVRLVAVRRRSSLMRSQLRDNQERLDVASAAAKLGLWTWDVHTDHFWVSDSAFALLGQPSSRTLTLKQLVDVQHPDDRELARKAFARAFGNPGQAQCRVSHHPPFRRCSVAGGARGGRFRSRRETAPRARGLDRSHGAQTTRDRDSSATQRISPHGAGAAMLSELSGSLAHEINQPLSGILSNAQAAQRILSRTPVATAELRDILHDIVAEDRRAGEVIRRMRTLLRKAVPNCCRWTLTKPSSTF